MVNNTNYDNNTSNAATSRGSNHFVLGSIVGGVVGAAAALLLAPKTGKEMRGDIGVQMSRVKEKAQSTMDTVKETSSEIGQVIREKAGNVRTDDSNHMNNR